ncbi:MAG TPA: hypothetical protein VJ608_01595 [Albitalea sp.]|nr:hypothetical protein [Albitalea sp.]
MARLGVSETGNNRAMCLNVSNCISLSPYLLDVIVISGFSPSVLVKQVNDDGERGGRRQAFA